MDAWAILRAVKGGRLSSTVCDEGYYVFHWRGVGAVSDDEALRLVEEWDRKLREALLVKATEIEDDLCRKHPKDAALYRARGVMYRAVTGY